MTASVSTPAVTAAAVSTVEQLFAARIAAIRDGI